MSAACFSLKGRFVDIRDWHGCNFKGIPMTKKTIFIYLPSIKSKRDQKRRKKISSWKPLRSGKVLDSITASYYISRYFSNLRPLMPRRRKLPRNQIYAFFKKFSQNICWRNKYMDFLIMCQTRATCLFWHPVDFKYLYVGRRQ